MAISHNVIIEVFWKMNAKQDILIGDTTLQRARPPTKEIPGAKIQNAARRVGIDF
jgi:hypothetical protein